jgi:tRNA threonylcarbamoyladenosine biosynthesis protein TsaB
MQSILSIETSGRQFSVSVYKNNTEVYSAKVEMEQSQEVLAAPVIDMAMKSVGLIYSELDAIAVGSGPGSYTGLRIGMALASGISFGSGVPIVPVGTLENLAFQILGNCPTAQLVLPVIEARKGEVFFGVWSRFAETPEIEPVCVGMEEFSLAIEKIIGPDLPVFFSSGDDARKILAEAGFEEIIGLSPDSISAAKIAATKLASGSFVQSVLDEPSYLKPVYISSPK